MLRPPLSDVHAAATASSCAGVGVGLRYPHHETFLSQRPPVGWLEIHAENYLGGIVLDDLLTIRQDYPISVHATGLSLGSAHGVSEEHLTRIAELCERVEPGLVSDHISWSACASGHYPDLLPLPYTQEALAICADNIDRVQNGLKRQILVENPSRYLAYAQSDFSEAEFLSELARRTDCGILVDLNNILVSASNLGRSPTDELAAVMGSVSPQAIGEIHVAGHAIELQPNGGQLRIDDHGSMVSEAVWQMLAAVTAWLGPRPVLIEWDTNIPDFGALQMEANHCRAIVELVEVRRHATG
jgi:uncharacterized protein (UPF0276 family)